MKPAYLIRILGLLASFLLLACNSGEDSALKQNAVPRDPNTKLIRVSDPLLPYPVLVTRDRGYRLACQNIAELGNLIEGLGLPLELTQFIETISPDDQRVTELNIDQQPVLSCDREDQVLYVIELDGVSKYFVAFSQDSNDLYMIGCQGLVDAMGFDLKEALSVPPFLIPLLNTGDENDLNCIDGTPVEQIDLEPSLRIEPQSQAVYQGDEILPASLSLINYSSENIEWRFIEPKNCSFLNIEGNSVVGRVPETFASAVCEETLLALENNQPIATQNIEITVTEDKAPVWSTPTKRQKTVEQGESIGLYSFQAVDPEGEEVSYSFIGLNACSWIETQGTDAIVVSGNVPEDAAIGLCALEIIASAGGKATEKAELLIEVTPKICSFPVYNLGRSEVCGVESYKLSQSAACGVESYLNLRSEACGVELYNSKTDARCGVDRYKLRSGSVCGVASYKSKASLKCPGSHPSQKFSLIQTSGGGRPTTQKSGNPVAPDGTNIEKIINGRTDGRNTSFSSGKWSCSVEIERILEPGLLVLIRQYSCRVKEKLNSCSLPEFGVASYKTCRHSSFGVDRYKSCRNEAFGVERYRLCRSPSHGVDTYKSCRSESHGVESYNLCRAPAFGIEYYEEAPCQ